MNIRDLEYVVAVSEERHFGRAAVRCHISQPALSGQIRKLEASLGVALFERTNRIVQVTPVGEQIVAQARRLITISDEIVATAQNARDPFSGQFRLGIIPTVGPYLSPLILTEISRGLPNLALTLVEGLTPDLMKRLANGDLDGAILATELEDPHLKEIVLYDEPFWVALSENHLLAAHETVDLGELSPEELLLLADGHCLRDQVVDACQAKTGINNANTRETSLETLFALVAAGDGVTLAPALTNRNGSRQSSTIVMRRERSGTAGRTVRLAIRVSYPRAEMADRLASIVRAKVPASLVTVAN